MSNIEVFSSTQVIEVENKTQTIQVDVQELIVDPVTLTTTVVFTTQEIVLEETAKEVSVINAGPQGPRGLPGPPGSSGSVSDPAQAAFNEASLLPNKNISYVNSLPDTIAYLDDNNILVYSSSIIYTNGLPVLVELTRTLDNQVFTKTITYVNSLPVSVEWQVV